MGKEDLSVKIHDYTLDFAEFIQRDSPAQRALLEDLRRSWRANFNSERYQDPAQEWYRRAFLERFVFMYDHDFYDRETSSYRIDELLDEGEKNFGGYDIICLWQSYPRLGIDHRNQYDYYRDMPGGIEGLKRVVERAHQRSVRVLLNYNPWDTGTRREGMSDGQTLAELLRATGADGLFLDTISKSDPDFHRDVESVRPGIVFDPEVMPKRDEAQLITGSWQQFGTMIPPGLITIRWLEPRHSLRGIDRDLLEKSRRTGINFFYGYGMILWENVFGWWNPYHYDEMRMVRKCVHLLRQFQDAFLDMDWQPYVPTIQSGVYANQWSDSRRTVYTLYNSNPDPVDGQILAVPLREGEATYDAWGGSSLTARVEAEGAVLSFRLEGQSPGCIVVQSKTLPPPVVLAEETLSERLSALDKSHDDASTHNRIYFPRALEDRRTRLEAHQARPVKPSERGHADNPPPGMVGIPAGRFVMNVRHNVFHWMEGACYGDISGRQVKDHPVQYFWMPAFWMDQAETTNQEYRRFLLESHYCPKDLSRFLEAWHKPEGKDAQPWLWEYPLDKANHPVVWVDLEDARAYAAWGKKRLPREEEWQYAAEGGQALIWPWGNEYQPDYCNGDSQDTTPVDRYPQGKSRFGCEDMCGNVWEWTESERDDGHTRYAIIRGGSHLRVVGSIWYTASGAQPNDVHEKILLMFPGLDRCSTVGFRCVKDLE